MGRSFDASLHGGDANGDVGDVSADEVGDGANAEHSTDEG